MRLGLRSSASLGSLALALTLLVAPANARIEPPRAQPSDSVEADDAADQRAKPTRKCKGKKATIVGNHKKNLLIGTPRRDVIWAGRGADTVLGRGGKDLICGGGGADALIGGAGRDKLYGGRNRDYCHGENREHRRHYKCEVHFNKLGEEVDPPAQLRPARASAAVAATGLSSTGAAARPDSVSRVAAYVGMDPAVCEPSGSALMDVHLGKVHFQAQYTNPGYIAVLPYYYRWGNSGFVDGPYYPSNWLQYYAPLDGVTYSADMFATHVPKSAGRIIMMYAVYWWNGAQWVDGTTLQVYHHYLQTTTGRIYQGGVCGY